MLAATHVAAGAAVGLLVQRPRPLVLAALGTHLLLDGVGHDDQTMSAAGQAVFGAAALGALAACWGPRSPVLVAGLVGSLPDAEIAADLLLTGGRAARFVFPSHWQVVRRRPPAHPYRFPGPGIGVRAEAAVTACALALLCAAGLRRRG